jgi:hypothetical protein
LPLLLSFAWSPVVSRPKTVDESRFSSVIPQMAALTDLTSSDDCEAFDLLPEDCQNHLRLAFDRLNTELQQLTGTETGAPIQGGHHDESPDLPKYI